MASSKAPFIIKTLRKRLILKSYLHQMLPLTRAPQQRRREAETECAEDIFRKKLFEP